MPLDLVESFKKREPEITRFAIEQKSAYMESQCRRKLSNRYMRLKASNDMAFNKQRSGRNIGGRGNNFQSKVSFPLVKERTIIRKAILKQNFRGEPVATVDPTGNTPQENAKNMQEVLNMNLKSTRFREKALNRLMQDCSQYGAAVSYTVFKEDNKKVMKTVSTKFGIDRQMIERRVRNTNNIPIHILDYFQDPLVADQDSTTFQGHVERITLQALISQFKKFPESFIQKNVEKIIAESKKASIEDSDFHQNKRSDKNENSNFNLDKTIIYSKFNIKGNEDNDNFYYAEIIGGKIVRFQVNPHDDDLVPYALFSIFKRDDYWWGNTDAEFVLPHENFTNLLMSMKADNALQAMQQYIFYGKGSINTSDWNNRHKNSGFVPVDIKHNKTLSQILHPFQPVDTSLQSTDSIMREVKENQQHLNPRPDLSRRATSGGLQNTTATAVNALEEQGDVIEADILESFMYGLRRLVMYNVVMLQQRLGDLIAIRPDVTSTERQITKEEMLGNFGYNIETSLNTNKSMQLLRFQNLLTMIMNFQGSGNPAFQNLNLIPLIRKLLKNADVGDVDELLPATEQFNQPGAQPTALMPGQELGGAVQELSQPNPQRGALNES